MPAVAGGDSGGDEDSGLAAAPIDIVQLDGVETAGAWLEALSASDGDVAVEPEWAGTPGRSAIVGLALCKVPAATAPAVPDVASLADALAVEAPETGAAVEVGWLAGDLLAEPALATLLTELLGAGPAGGRIVAHRAKELMRALEPIGIDFSGLALDTAVAGYLADPRIGQATLERLAEAAAGCRGERRTVSRLGAPAPEGGGEGDRSSWVSTLAGTSGRAEPGR